MKKLMVIMLVLVSCARKDNECRSKESMSYECQVVHSPQYGNQWAQEECSRRYQSNKCY